MIHYWDDRERLRRDKEARMEAARREARYVEFGPADPSRRPLTG